MKNLIEIFKSVILVLVFLLVTNATVKSQCVNPPTPLITPSGATTFCIGGSVSLDAGVYQSWSWSNSGTDQAILVSTNGNYVVTVTDIDGCTGTASIDITVNPLPTVSFALASSYGYNGIVSLTGLPSGGTFSGAGVSGTIFTPATVGVGGPYSITYTYTDINGCSNNISHSTNVLAAYNGPSSSASPYIVPTAPGVTITSILTTPDVIGGYEMEGTPDGLGAFDNGDGTFTLLMNHEFLTSNGVARAHGSQGSFVSKWKIDKSTLAIISGADLIQNVNLWDMTTSTYTTYNASNPSILARFGRFCSADLPAVSAFYNSTTGMGTQERIFMNGEETNDTSRAFAHIVTGPNGGTSWELPALGKAAWENAVACPISSNKTIVGLDNDGTDGQVYFYIGTKTNAGNEITKAGLTNGHPWGVKVTGFQVERVNSTTINTPPAPGTHFDLVDLGDVRNVGGIAFNTMSNTAGVTKFSRPEDGCWDPSHPNDYYFNTTDQLDQVNDGVGTQVGRTRVWRLRFTDIYNPELGGTIEAVLDGTEGCNMLDNMTIDHYGHLLLNEDVGNAAHNGKVWQYTIATDALKMIAKHDPARFGDIGIPATAPFTYDKETSGVLDVQDILGAGMFLNVVQAHYLIAGPAVEGGQLQAIFNPDTYNSSLCATTSSTSVTACGSYVWNNYTYTSSGTYSFHTTNSNGCDSAATLLLTINPLPVRPTAFTTKTTFVYKGDNSVAYTVPNQSGVTYSWAFTGTGGTINGTNNTITIDYSSTATSGTLRVTVDSNGCTSPARTLAIVLNDPIIVPTTNFDYSFVTVGCNRVDYLDTAITSGDPDYATGKSTANVYQLKRLFTEISHLNPLPHFLVMTGDIVMGYKTPSTPDTTELAKQLTAWREIYEGHPLSLMGIILIAIPGNHETQDKAAGKHSFAAAEQIFTRIMAPYILGSNGPGIGGPDNLTTDQSKLTYSFDYGGDHYIMIDTDPVGKDNEAPYKWIATDIQNARANHARHIFTFGHKPAYSSPLTPAGGLDAASTLSARDSLWKYLENNNCEAMFSAHEHLWDTINPHTGKTWQVINGNGGTRVEPIWVGSGRQYYGYTIVNLYTNRMVNVMGVGRNTDMSTTVGVPYTINEDAYPSTVRNNFNICLTTTSSATASACTSYTWNNITYTSSGTYTYTTPNAAGCDSIATLYLTINPLPTVTAGDVIGCSGYSIPLVGSPAGGTFSIPNPYTGTNTTYTYTYTDGNGCSNTSTSANITVISQINNLSIAGQNSACSGGNVTLTTGVSYNSYLWNTGATTQSINVTNTGIYYVTVSNGGSCTAVAHKSVTIMIAPMPNILPSNLANVCGGGNATLNVGASFAAYNWSTGATTQSIIINSGGTYSVTVTNGNSCTGISSIAVNGSCDMPTFPTTPTTSIGSTYAMANWIQPTCHYGYTVRISVHNLNVWVSHTIMSNTHYTFSQLARNTTYDWQIQTNCDASATVNSGFSTTQTFTTLARMEGDENAAIDGFNVYPNPANDQASVVFSSDKEESVTIYMVDVIGRIVLDNSIASVIGENQFQMNLSKVARGIYTVVLQNGDGTIQRKIVVE